ncbi:MAG TPA: ATP-binding protein [Bacteroidia bacterium]|nr:ATP-binding protein [Bacteroidia bacterium]
MIRRYSGEEFDLPETPSGNMDILDRIIERLNVLDKDRSDFIEKKIESQERIEKLMAVLLKYTLLDFTETLEVSDNGDEIDAIGIGLTALSEELQAAISAAKLRLEIVEESKLQIETILENAPNGVIIINEKGSIVKWNKKSEAIFGWSADEVLNHSMHELIMPDRYVKAHQHGINHFLHTGEGPVINKTIEISAIRKNKEEFPIELSISAIKSDGKFLFIAFISDISIRKHAEEEIKRINENLADSFKAMESFTYSVSHDLRAPLRAIHGYVNILKNEYSEGMDETGKSMLGSVISNSKKMGQLIDDLLALSRLERTVLQRKQVNMNELVKSVIHDATIEDKKTEFTLHKMPDAYADPNLIVQVCTNLISNAIKYSSLKEKPVVEIGALTENGEVIYYVKDNGSGFDMQFYNKLFGVFQRLHDNSEFEGNGIGLSIVKQIITRHKGRIWAYAEPDKGATFYFTLDEPIELI